VARIVNGGNAISSALSSLNARRVSPNAMFREMSRSGRGYQFMTNAGVNASPATQSKWLKGGTPSASNTRAIEKAYGQWAGSNVRRRAGRIVEVYPSSANTDRYGRPVRNIALTDDEINDMIEANNRGDTDQLNQMWRTAVDREMSTDSPPSKAYYNISHVAFGFNGESEDEGEE
jgi:hypothetical protein